MLVQTAVERACEEVPKPAFHRHDLVRTESERPVRRLKAQVHHDGGGSKFRGLVPGGVGPKNSHHGFRAVWARGQRAHSCHHILQASQGAVYALGKPALDANLRFPCHDSPLVVQARRSLEDGEPARNPLRIAGVSDEAPISIRVQTVQEVLQGLQLDRISQPQGLRATAQPMPHVAHPGPVERVLEELRIHRRGAFQIDWRNVQHNRSNINPSGALD